MYAYIGSWISSAHGEGKNVRHDCPWEPVEAAVRGLGWAGLEFQTPRLPYKQVQEESWMVSAHLPVALAQLPQYCTGTVSVYEQRSSNGDARAVSRTVQPCCGIMNGMWSTIHDS